MTNGSTSGIRHSAFGIHQVSSFLRPLSFGLRHLALLALIAANATAATVGSTRIDEGSGEQKQIAVITFSSITDAVKGISDGLSGLGADGAGEAAETIVSWMTMLPPFDFADPKREASVILVTPRFEQETPDQIAIIPLSPLNGESILRATLSAAYGRISGNSVLFCSEPKDEESLPTLALIVTRDTAFIANDRESLKWIARRWKEGNVPSAPHLRDGATASAVFDARLAGKTVAALLPGDVADDARDAARLIGWFRDLLGNLESLHVSLSADLRSWRLAARLSPKEGVGRTLFAAERPDGKTLRFIPRDAYCVSAGLFRQFSALLPESLVARYSGISSYSFFTGFGILPGVGFESRSRNLEPFLSGEASSAYVISRGDAVTARVKSFALSDPKGAAAALDAIFSDGISAEQATVRKPRIVNGRKIYSYTSVWQASEDVADDYVASVLVLLANLNCVEIAIDGDQMLVVSGPYGTVEKLLDPGALAAKSRAIDSLAPFLGALPDGESLLGSGELQPSRAFLALMQSKPGLEGLARHLPRHGGGIAWRISRDEGDAIYEVSLATSELFALSMLKKFDQKQLGHILLEDIVSRAATAQ